MEMDGATSLKLRQVCSCSTINPSCLYTACNQQHTAPVLSKLLAYILPRQKGYHLFQSNW